MLIEKFYKSAEEFHKKFNSKWSKKGQKLQKTTEILNNSSFFAIYIPFRREYKPEMDLKWTKNGPKMD